MTDLSTSLSRFRFVTPHGRPSAVKLHPQEAQKKIMSKIFGAYHPTTPRLGKFMNMAAESLSQRFCAHRHIHPRLVCQITILKSLGHVYDQYFCRSSAKTMFSLEEASLRLARGDRIRLLGLNFSSHNAGVALVEASKDEGIGIVRSNEEERFSGIKHDHNFPGKSIADLMQEQRISHQNVDYILCPW